jgi:anti-sigma regulatory factor (Ser/Thr protein kinase)
MPETRNDKSPSSGSSGKVVEVRQDIDAFVARVAVRELAERLGFTPRQAEELALVATELATNIIKHSRSGSILIEAFRDRELGPGVRMVARDVGPPIQDFALASLDGYCDLGPLDPSLRRRGIGAGLGSIARLSDRVEHAVERGGNVVTVSRYVVRLRRTAS